MEQRIFNLLFLLLSRSLSSSSLSRDDFIFISHLSSYFIKKKSLPLHHIDSINSTKFNFLLGIIQHRKWISNLITTLNIIHQPINQQPHYLNIVVSVATKFPMTWSLLLSNIYKVNRTTTDFFSLGNRRILLLLNDSTK